MGELIKAAILTCLPPACANSRQVGTGRKTYIPLDGLKQRCYLKGCQIQLEEQISGVSLMRHGDIIEEETDEIAVQSLPVTNAYAACLTVSNPTASCPWA